MLKVILQLFVLFLIVAAVGYGLCYKLFFKIGSKAKNLAEDIKKEANREE